MTCMYMSIMHVCIYVCICMCVYIYIYIYIYTSLYPYISLLVRLRRRNAQVLNGRAEERDPIGLARLQRCPKTWLDFLDGKTVFCRSGAAVILAGLKECETDSGDWLAMKNMLDKILGIVKLGDNMHDRWCNIPKMIHSSKHFGSNHSALLS